MSNCNCIETLSRARQFKIYHKSSIKPPWAYSILGTPEGGLLRGRHIREGGLFKKLDEKDIYDSFISLLPHVMRIQHTILRVKYTDVTQSYSKPHQTNIQTCIC